MSIENINNHQAFVCECGSVHFNLLRSNLIECSGCGGQFGYWSKTEKPIAKVINNNQPGWTNIIETEPNVTLIVGTELFLR